MKDTYKTIAATSQGVYKEKMSRFLSFAIPVTSSGEIKEQLEKYQKKYYDARHICWAYVLGADRSEYRSNDNGEPSGTAGKPILGQINSFELTDVLVIVVRYFGGIKLGTGGLAVAYREAAADAIRNNTPVERLVETVIHCYFEYPFLHDVMKVVKEGNAMILCQHFELECYMSLRIRLSEAENLKSRLRLIPRLTLKES